MKTICQSGGASSLTLNSLVIEPFHTFNRVNPCRSRSILLKVENDQQQLLLILTLNIDKLKLLNPEVKSCPSPPSGWLTVQYVNATLLYVEMIRI